MVSIKRESYVIMLIVDASGFIEPGRSDREKAFKKQR